MTGAESHGSSLPSESHGMPLEERRTAGLPMLMQARVVGLTVNRAAGSKNQPEAIFSKWQGDEQMFKSIPTFLIGITPILLLGLVAEVHAQAATDVDCPRCVDDTDIAAQAVTTGKLRDDAVIHATETGLRSGHSRPLRKIDYVSRQAGPLILY